MGIPQQILKLVETFERNADDYRSAQFNEAMLRQQFVNPMFKCLGWDMDNEQGYAEAYKDVIHEASLKIGGETKAPDYLFRIGGTAKFYLEAKKPAVNIYDDPAPAYQLRRYAWSAKMPLSILTNFEEFAVYDCRVKPAQTDKASVARINYWQYGEYAENWEQLAGVFAREAILKGDFDRLAESKKAKKGTATVDAAFLEEMEHWRLELAKNLALRNPDLSLRELNFAVQITIDRIIFLRMCEDRGIEPYGQLRDLQNEGEVYQRLCEFFRKADQRYNSGLFHFGKEKERTEAPDELTPSLAIDDKVLKGVFKGLYYPDSPYEFSVIPVEILGQVYEQFLGKVIRLTSSHQAKVEEKPEVKKAGGVYYTPAYIVDYIVEHTVGKLLEDKTPKQAEKLRILDPACGSGSFLLGAYQHLLNWHLGKYLDDGPENHRKEIFQTTTGWRLTTAEKKRILLNNIDGVDIDSQAVEVTKLSLLLKVLDGESQETLDSQLKMFHERALPDLASNIKCGNSLIGPEFYDGYLANGHSDEERFRINAFDWRVNFPEATNAGGFDAVIGNPPYIRIQTLREWAPLEVDFFKQRYAAAGKGSYDIYVIFVERGLSLLAQSGRLGFILPNKFLSTDYGAELRRHLSQAVAIGRIVDFGHSQVFANATTYTCLLFLDRSQPPHVEYVQLTPDELAETHSFRKIAANSLSSGPWLFADRARALLLSKVQSKGVPLLEFSSGISRGISTGADEIFCLARRGAKLEAPDGTELKIENAILRQPIYGTDYTRYHFRPRNNDAVIFPYEKTASGFRLIDEKRMQARFPKAYEYLRSNKKQLTKRKHEGAWFGFSAPRSLDVHEQADFLVPVLADKGLCAPIDRQTGSFCMMAGAGFSILLDREKCRLHPWYVLALVNSKLLFWNLRQISNKFRGGWVTCTRQYFGTLTIRTIDAENSSDQSRHDRMVHLVDQMLDLHKQLAAAKTPHERSALETQIAATDRQIDRLVYDLYGLTEEEIKIVEGATS